MPDEAKQLTKDTPEMLETLQNPSGFPSFDTLVKAYKMSVHGELARQLLDREAELHAC